MPRRVRAALLSSLLCVGSVTVVGEALAEPRPAREGFALSSPGDSTLGPHLVAGEERPVSSPAYGPVAGSQVLPSVASDGTDYLVVWEDDRREQFARDVFAARVRADGAVLDRSGLPVSVQPGDQARPAVAFGGGLYLVVWEEVAADGSVDVVGVRLRPSGRILDRRPIPISAEPFAQALPDVAWDGTRFLVVWEDDRDGDTVQDVYGARVGVDGEVLDPDGIAISSARNNQFHPHVAPGGGGFVVVWADDRDDDDFSFDPYAARVASTGTVRDPGGIRLSSDPVDQFGVAVAGGGSNVLVAWLQRRPQEFATDVRGARLSFDGTVLDPDPLPLVTLPGEQVSVDVGWNGDRFLVATTDLDPSTASALMVAVRVTSGGRVQDGPITLSPKAAAEFPAVASANGDFLVVWDDLLVGTDSEVFGTRVSGAGRVLDERPLLLSTAGDHQVAPVVAWNGRHHLVVWQAYRGGWDLYARKFVPDGRPEGSAFAVSAAPGNQTAPAVVWDGVNFLVVWEDTRSERSFEVFGARVSPAGRVLDRNGLRLSTARGSQFNPAVSWGGSSHLVVWEDTRSGETIDVYGTRVSRDGRVRDDRGVAISTAPLDQRNPVVASNGEHFLVAWEDQRFDDFTDPFAARVGTDGAVLDPEGIRLSDAPQLQIDPTVACTRDGCLVAWSDSRSGFFTFDVFGTRVDEAGRVADPEGIAIDISPGDQTRPAAAAIPRGYVLAWRTARRDGIDLAGTLVSDGGRVFDPGLLTTTFADEGGPALSTDPSGRALLAYDRFAEARRYRAQRVFVRPVQTA